MVDITHIRIVPDMCSQHARFTPRRRRSQFGNVPFIQCVSSLKGLRCFRKDEAGRRVSSSWSPRRRTTRARIRRRASLSPFKTTSYYGGRRLCLSPRRAVSSGSLDQCREECVRETVRNMRVPTDPEAHYILDHMRCTCSACMNYACNWRKAVMDEFHERLRDPKPPKMKARRWMPAFDRKPSPVYDCSEGYHGKSICSPARRHTRGPRRSPKVSWWFGNYVPSSDSESLKQTRRNSARGYDDVAMDGTVRQSRMRYNSRTRPCDDSMPRDPQCVDSMPCDPQCVDSMPCDPQCVDSIPPCSPSAETFMVRPRPRQRKRLAQGIEMENTTRDDPQCVDSMPREPQCVNSMPRDPQCVDSMPPCSPNAETFMVRPRPRNRKSLVQGIEIEKTTRDDPYFFCQREGNSHSHISYDSSHNKQNKALYDREWNKRQTDRDGIIYLSQSPAKCRYDESDIKDSISFHRGKNNQENYSDDEHIKYPRHMNEHIRNRKYQAAEDRHTGHLASVPQRTTHTCQSMNDGHNCHHRRRHYHHHHHHCNHHPLPHQSASVVGDTRHSYRGICHRLKDEGNDNLLSGSTTDYSSNTNHPVNAQIKDCVGFRHHPCTSNNELASCYRPDKQYTPHHSDHFHSNNDAGKANWASDISVIENSHNDYPEDTRQSEFDMFTQSGRRSRREDDYFYKEKPHDKRKVSENRSWCKKGRTMRVEDTSSANSSSYGTCHITDERREDILAGNKNYCGRTAHSHDMQNDRINRCEKYDERASTGKFYTSSTDLEGDCCSNKNAISAVKLKNQKSVRNTNHSGKEMRSIHHPYRTNPRNQCSSSEVKLIEDVSNSHRPSADPSPKEHQVPHNFLHRSQPSPARSPESFPQGPQSRVRFRSQSHERESSDISTSRRPCSPSPGGIAGPRTHSCNRRSRSRSKRPGFSTRARSDTTSSRTSPMPCPSTKPPTGKDPFHASGRVMNEPMPENQREWLDKHISLMTDCSQQLRENAEARTSRIVEKTKELKRSMADLHMDFGDLEDRLNKVRDLQSLYLSQADKAINMARERNDILERHHRERQNWLDAMCNFNTGNACSDHPSSYTPERMRRDDSHFHTCRKREDWKSSRLRQREDSSSDTDRQHTHTRSCDHSHKDEAPERRKKTRSRRRDSVKKVMYDISSSSEESSSIDDDKYRRRKYHRPSRSVGGWKRAKESDCEGYSSDYAGKTRDNAKSRVRFSRGKESSGKQNADRERRVHGIYNPTGQFRYNMNNCYTEDMNVSIDSDCSSKESQKVLERQLPEKTRYIDEMALHGKGPIGLEHERQAVSETGDQLEMAPQGKSWRDAKLLGYQSDVEMGRETNSQCIVNQDSGLQEECAKKHGQTSCHKNRSGASNNFSEISSNNNRMLISSCDTDNKYARLCYNNNALQCEKAENLKSNQDPPSPDRLGCNSGAVCCMPQSCDRVLKNFSISLCTEQQSQGRAAKNRAKTANSRNKRETHFAGYKKTMENHDSSETEVRSAGGNDFNNLEIIQNVRTPSNSKHAKEDRRRSSGYSSNNRTPKTPSNDSLDQQCPSSSSKFSSPICQTPSPLPHHRRLFGTRTSKKDEGNDSGCETDGRANIFNFPDDAFLA